MVEVRCTHHLMLAFNIRCKSWAGYNSSFKAGVERAHASDRLATGSGWGGGLGDRQSASQPVSQSVHWVSCQRWISGVGWSSVLGVEMLGAAITLIDLPHS